MSESVNELCAALAAAQAEIRDPARDAENPHFRSRYATLGAVLDAARPVLARHGIAVVQEVTLEPAGASIGVGVTTIIMHTSGEWVECGPTVAAVRDSSPQAVGSAVTYLRRYTLLAAVGAAPAEDDDAEAAQAGAPAATCAQEPRAERDWGAFAEEVRAEISAADADALPDIARRIREAAPPASVRDALRRAFSARKRELESGAAHDDAADYRAAVDAVMAAASAAEVDALVESAEAAMAPAKIKALRAVAKLRKRNIEGGGHASDGE